MARTGRPPVPIENRFWLKVRIGPDCWEWTSTRNEQGYGQIWDNQKGGQRSAHRFSWELHFGSIPPGLVVRHMCHNTSCVRPSHLALGTTAENVADNQTNPRMPRGERHPRAKLSEADVLVIRALRGLSSQSQIARAFGVTQALISHIQTGRIWKAPLT